MSLRQRIYGDAVVLGRPRGGGSTARRHVPGAGDLGRGGGSRATARRRIYGEPANLGLLRSWKGEGAGTWGGGAVDWGPLLSSRIRPVPRRRKRLIRPGRRAYGSGGAVRSTKGANPGGKGADAISARRRIRSSKSALDLEHQLG